MIERTPRTRWVRIAVSIVVAGVVAASAALIAGTRTRATAAGTGFAPAAYTLEFPSIPVNLLFTSCKGLGSDSKTSPTGSVVQQPASVTCSRPMSSDLTLWKLRQLSAENSATASQLIVLVARSGTGSVLFEFDLENAYVAKDDYTTTTGSLAKESATFRMARLIRVK
jgi:hypothetical protein